MMNKTGTIAALLEEYQKAIIELQNTITNIDSEKLSVIVDNQTTDLNCKSIQTILTHVIGSGYSYCVYIRNHRGIMDTRPEKILKPTTEEYIEDLNKVFDYTFETFQEIENNELEEYDNTKKIKTMWGQQYDIEQLMEHAIVHVLKHRRQIELYKKKI